MAELIATGTTAADSADFELSDGESTTLFLKKATSGSVDVSAFAEVQIKDAGGAYHPVTGLSFHQPSIVLAAPGTYRVSRPASSTAFGVDRV